jgi:hypothetical protein
VKDELFLTNVCDAMVEQYLQLIVVNESGNFSHNSKRTFAYTLALHLLVEDVLQLALHLYVI